MCIIPHGAKVGSTLEVAFPDYGGQVLLVVVPAGVKGGQHFRYPFEVSATGVVQYPLDAPDARSDAPGVAADARTVSRLAQQPRPARYCACRCCGEGFALVLATLSVPVLMAIVIGNAALSPLAAFACLALAAMCPVFVILAYLHCSYRSSVLKKQMLITAMEAVVWLVPLMGFHILVAVSSKYVAPFHVWSECKCPRSEDDDICNESVGCHIQDAVRAFVLAALFEEVLKYLCIRRIAFASCVVDVQGLFVYGGCAALGFSLVENVSYVLRGGINVALGRSILTIPAHVAWGLMQGCALGRRRFLNKPIHYYHALLLPVLSHGLYDWFLFHFRRQGGGELKTIGLAGAVGTLVLTWMYIRRLAVGLDGVPAADVRALIEDGKVQRPRLLCCMCRWQQQAPPPDEEGGGSAAAAAGGAPGSRPEPTPVGAS